MEKNAGNRQPTVTKLAVFRRTEYSAFHTSISLAVCLGSIHLLVVLLLGAFLLSPSPLAFIIFALLIFLTVIPVDGGSQWEQRFSRYICKYICGYFPITLHVEDIRAFDPNQAYVFGFEPHSILPFGFAALVNSTGFMPLPKIKVLAHSAMLHMPIVQQIFSWLGFTKVTRKNFVSQLTAGCSCIIVPGGIREIAHMEHGSEVAFLKARKGFVRVAMETGAPLVPVFCFAQTNVYRWWRPSGALAICIYRAFEVPPILFRGILGSLVPYRQPIHVVVGQPIELKKNPKPTIEEVAEVHSHFVVALQELFEKHKARLGHADLQLKIL